MAYEIGQIFDGVYPPDAAAWCNRNSCFIYEYEPENGRRKFMIKEVPAPTERAAALCEISELKAKLAETDYVVMKIAEGVATKEEYAEVLENRAKWRAKINELDPIAYPDKPRVDLETITL